MPTVNEGRPVELGDLSSCRSERDRRGVAREAADEAAREEADEIAKEAAEEASKEAYDEAYKEA